MLWLLFVPFIRSIYSEYTTYPTPWSKLESGNWSDGCEGLSEGQRKLCMLYPDHRSPVISGLYMAISECQHQFKFRRWNCSLINQTSPFSPITTIGSRESAFLSGVCAAGVSYSIARHCKDGTLSSCTCSRAPRPNHLHKQWKWGGCGDNLVYGYRFSQSFVDVREREESWRRGSLIHAKALMNLHNNEAGRRAVMKMSHVACKCHGVSGSCSLITCWQQLPAFRVVGDYLKDKYDGATEVRMNKRGKLEIAEAMFRVPTANDLIYLTPSPDYCTPNASIGSLGTEGRTCNKTSVGTDGCDLMCCGRGYKTQKMNIVNRCECQFHWCCYVTCKMCVETVDVHTCK